MEPVRRTYSGDQPSASPTPSAAKPSSIHAGHLNTPAIDPVKKAQAEYNNGNYTTALDTLKPVSVSTLSAGSQTEYWNLKGLAQLASNAPSSAEKSFQYAVSSNPNPNYAGYYQYNLASAFADEKKSEDAMHVLNLIDLKQMDSADQRKVALLKEKLTRGETGSLMAAAPIPSSTPAVNKPVYSGPVNEHRVGLLLPLSGKYESFGKKVQQAIELAFQNSEFVKDHQIELIAMDSGDTPASHQEALKKLVEEQQVIAVIGPLLSKGVEALPERSDYYQIPLVSIAQAQGQASPFLYSCSVSNEDQAARVVDYAMKERGYKRFAILAPSNKPGQEMANAFWDQVLAHGGEVKGFELYEPGLNDFRAPVDKTLGLFYTETRAKELKDLADKRKEMDITKKTMKTIQYFELPPIIDFDAVFIADEAKTVGQIIPTFAYRNAKDLPYLGISSWNSSQLISRAGDQAENAVFPVAFNTLNPPEASKKFFDLYSKTYDSAPGELDAVAYDAASAILEVLKDKPSTREEFNQKLSNLVNFEGATGALSIKDHHCSRTLTLYTVKKGEFQPVKADAENKD
jgi:branched-chain amino acid transport system substrate-binding protein